MATPKTAHAPAPANVKVPQSLRDTLVRLARGLDAVRIITLATPAHIRALAREQARSRPTDAGKPATTATSKPKVMRAGGSAA